MGSVSHSVVSDSLRPCGLEPSRLLCPWNSLRIPLPSPGDLSDPGIEPGSLALQADPLASEPQGSLTKLLAKAYQTVHTATSTLLLSHRVVSDYLVPHGLQHAMLLCLPLSPRVCSNSCPLSWWYYLTISPSAALCSSCLQSFPASGSFPMSQLFPSGGQNTGASASVFLMNIQDWFPLGWTGWISLQSKGLKCLLKHDSLKASILRCSAFFMVQLSHLYMTTGKTIALTMWTFVSKVISLLFNTLFRFVITFLLRSKHLLISLTSTLHLLKLTSKLLNSTFSVVTFCYKIYVNICVYLYSCVCIESCLCVPLNIWKVVNPGELDTKRVRWETFIFSFQQ